MCQEFLLSRGLIGFDGCINDYNLKCMCVSCKQSDLHTHMDFLFFFLSEAMVMAYKKEWQRMKENRSEICCQLTIFHPIKQSQFPQFSQFVSLFLHFSFQIFLFYIAFFFLSMNIFMFSFKVRFFISIPYTVNVGISDVIWHINIYSP